MNSSGSPRPAWLRVVAAFSRWTGRVLLGVVILLLTAWSMAAIYYSNLPVPFLRTTLALAFGLGTLAAFALLPRRRRTTLGFFAAFAVVLVWWILIPASNDRDWAVDVARLPEAEFHGDQVTIHNIRDFDYRSTEDFDARWIDRTYDLSKLESVDLFLSYWDGNRAIAHMILSFGFGHGQWVAVSIETRKEKTEGYSTIAGFFKQYELIYVIATERDLIRLRTNHRREEVYLYPSRLTPDEGRDLFRSLLEKANGLVEHPVFYNALVHNCTTAWIAVSEGIRREPFEFDYRMLMNGYYDQLAYERHRIVADASQGEPYEEMRARHLVTGIAAPYDRDPDFSSKIRSHLPARSGR